MNIICVRYTDNSFNNAYICLLFNQISIITYSSGKALHNTMKSANPLQNAHTAASKHNEFSTHSELFC